jgi:hypothetical protein
MSVVRVSILDIPVEQLDLARAFSEIPGVTFVRPIPNFEGLWQWGDTSGGAAPGTAKD